jgi:hypothetical protein
MGHEMLFTDPADPMHSTFAITIVVGKLVLIYQIYS